jgi:hypothetical protein
MNHFENLWQQYLRTELGGQLPPPVELANLRNAFFTGAWCQMMFHRKMQGMASERALSVMKDVEEELVREAIAHVPNNANRTPSREPSGLAA